MAIECKSYLDLCYYKRACSDFQDFKAHNFNLKYIIFSLENSIKEESKEFVNYSNNNICYGIYYMLDGKRSSKNPIYSKKKEINIDKLNTFIDMLFDTFKI